MKKYTTLLLGLTICISGFGDFSKVCFDSDVYFPWEDSVIKDTREHCPVGKIEFSYSKEGAMTFCTDNQKLISADYYPYPEMKK